MALSGIKVRLLEKDRFPRFHIGESLLPRGNQNLKKIRVFEKVESAGFINKYGAEFISPDGKKISHNNFSRGLIPGMEQTWQVERSIFDKILLDHSKSLGVDVQEECKVTNISINDACVEYTQINKITGIKVTKKANFIVDATGRNCLLGNKLKIEKENIPYPKKLACYGHFKNVQRSRDKFGGNIRIVRIPDGWFWNIPISEEVTSVGFVSYFDHFKNKKPEDLFKMAKSKSAFQSEIMEHAELINDYRITSDYTYSYRSYAGDRYIMVGDAASFIDPVFSSGVYLATESGIRAADLIIKYRNSLRLPSPVQKKYTKSMKQQIKTMRSLIEVFYDDDSFSVFMNPRNKWKIASAVNSLVAGNTDLPLNIKVRYWLFLLLCKINKKVNIVPKLSLN